MNAECAHRHTHISPYIPLCRKTWKLATLGTRFIPSYADKTRRKDIQTYIHTYYIKITNHQHPTHYVVENNNS